MNQFEEWMDAVFGMIGGMFAAIGAVLAAILAMIGVALYILFWLALAVIVFHVACNILQ